MSGCCCRSAEKQNGDVRVIYGDKKEDIMKDYKIVQRTLQRIAKSEKEIRQDAISMKSTKKKENEQVATARM